MATQAPPRTAARYQIVSAAAAQSGVRAARVARPKGIRSLWSVVATYQTAQAQLAEQATAEMLLAQDIDVAAEALLNSPAFTMSLNSFNAMLEKVEQDWQFDQLVASLVQDAGRTAQSVSVAARPHIGFVRMLTPPSCGRCAVLAGRVYRYSQGFDRHPGDDCVMLPTTVANDQYAQDPTDLVERGLVTGLSKADRQAILDGADVGKVVNVRLLKAGLTDSGRVLSRRGRPTPEAIYRLNPTREDALAALQAAGYLR